ncbi:MAG: nitrogenase iron-molybdenum cofactor biosynthesis protein NifE [Coriobacteriales bacterium]|jgi:nitrogenase molybdenum-cofactor synthesis protein NifE|nr:nitrogenase iron-molybdenum cofactor biosynthesis protein NifE [Coriobacteriales bacterium]
MVQSILKERESSIIEAGSEHAVGCAVKNKDLVCNQGSAAGAVSQKACVFCGARVVLNPITDAFHIIHGPIGCSSYTWDIRGSLSSGSELYRHSFSTDMQETDIIFGGEKKLAQAIDEAVATYSPKLIFVYATCIVGVIGDDVEAVCRQAEQRHVARNGGMGLRVIPVMAPGFSGHKAIGYKLAGDAIMRFIGTKPYPRNKAHGINILGDFNLAGETWIVRSYLENLRIEVLGSLTGDSSSESLLCAREARLNVVQCAGSSINLAEKMQDILGIPYIRVSFYGIEDTVDSIMRIAQTLAAQTPGADMRGLVSRAEQFCLRESKRLNDALEPYRTRLVGNRAAIYVGGGFKAISLIRQFRELDMDTVMVGTQTGRPEDYEVIRALVSPGCIVLDDANPAELEKFMVEKGADILVGGVKERPLAYKLGVAFCDHNHERKYPLAGFVGVENFAQEINRSVNSPVWRYANKRQS